MSDEKEPAASAAVQTRQTKKSAEAPATKWVEFLTSQSGFSPVVMPDGSTSRGAQFSHVRGDKVEKPTREADALIARGTCKPCAPPREGVAA